MELWTDLMFCCHRSLSDNKDKFRMSNEAFMIYNECLMVGP